MSDKKQSDHQEMPESTHNSPGADFMGQNGEEIIELTEIVTKAELAASRALAQPPAASDDEDDIIELTDIVGPQSEGADAMADAEPDMDDADDIIELIDIAEPQSEGADAMADAEPDMDDADDIIELIDIAEPQSEGTDAMAEAEPAMGGEDDIIELTDMIEPETTDEEWAQLTLSELTDPDAEEVTGQLPDSNEYLEKQHQSINDTLSELESMMDQTFSGEEGLIDLNDVPSDQDEPETAFDSPEDLVLEEAALDSRDQDEDDFPIGIALDETPDDTAPDQPLPSLTNEQIDAAVERLILAKYGQTIEQFIAASIEKIVTKQIESLRQSLLEDDGPMD